MNSKNAVLSPEYREATKVALSLQIPIAILCLLILDGGYLSRLCGVGMLAFWLVAGEVALRRPWRPAPSDLWYWRWGLIPCFAAATWLAGML